MNFEFFRRRALRPAISPERLQAGVALIITLILLSVITVITITILAIVRRDRNVVTQAANLTDARLAAEAALERAKFEMIGQILRSTNLMGYDLTVSRSFSNALDRLRYDPRVPVFPPNLLSDEQVEGRFFLDLNRNRRFEDTLVTNLFGKPYWLLTGDPQWIGILNKPDQPHTNNNKFIARYAYIVLPADKALDLNFIHNMSSTNRLLFGFFRNQGFGSWELNMAGFLRDLNPNLWSYLYTPFPLPASDGDAFADARSFVNYRYAGNVLSMPTIGQLYGQPAVDAFSTDFIDNYAHAPLAMGPGMPDYEPERPQDIANVLRWPGADSLRHYDSHQELLDPIKTSTNFVGRLNWAGQQADDANRYTFYNLLNQLATDSAPVEGDKVHLNYVNLPVHFETYNKIRSVFTTLPMANPLDDYVPVRATNFVPWDLPEAPELSVHFFTNVAQRLLKRQFESFNTDMTIGITNIPSVIAIPIAPTNLYSPAMHRLLQEAANIYDATRADQFPSVFRPLFTVTDVTNVVLTGWTNDNQRSTLPAWLTENRIHGIPLVIGAKKGFPNFNEFTIRTVVDVTRKLEFVRPTTNSPPNGTNQMYVVGISNLLAVEAWNSYQSAYPNRLQVEVTDYGVALLTNTYGLNLPLDFTNSFAATLQPNEWGPRTFMLPLYTNQIILRPSVYRFGARAFDPVAVNTYETGIGFPLPDWSLSLSNHFLFIVSDADKIVDFVVSRQFNTYMNVDDEMLQQNQVTPNESQIVANLWDTNRVDGNTVAHRTWGIQRQIDIALGNTTVDDTLWRSYVGNSQYANDKPRSIASFRLFLRYGSIGGAATNAFGMTSLRMQSPFNPTRKFVKTTSWQANDPLVHYHVGDLMIIDPTQPDKTNAVTEFVVPPTQPIPTNLSIATIYGLNKNYSPWGGNPDRELDPNNPRDPNLRNYTIKDPGQRNSDDWDFPKGKFGNVGWLGRVHRGSPWQTIFWKPADLDSTRIQAWRGVSGDWLFYPTNGEQRFQYVRNHPTNDWVLPDLFTIATDRNSTRGLLSVNQTNIAAWSALFSGLVLLKNPLPDRDVLSITTNWAIPLDPLIVEPVANDTNLPPALLTLIDGINRFRRTLPNETFTHLSQFFQVPELTMTSPWLNLSDIQRDYALNDVAYERIPQMILSLVKIGEPRFVVFAYGQALKPAKDSVLTSPTLVGGRVIPEGVCTNYQVTAEVSARAVIRVEGPPQNPRTVIESFNLLPPD